MEEDQLNKPVALNNLNKDKVKVLDVRPIINSGKDPFTDIMSFLKDIKDDEIFLLKNSFEPLPLYAVLGKKGYEHFTEINETVYEVYFYKTVNDQNIEVNRNGSSEIIESQNDLTNVIEIDVRDLEPPEPMVKILEAIQQVDGNSLLVVHHHREPMMLYPKLEERGYQAITNKIDENYYKVVITKKE
ncbi:MAG: DUF2249 domain-containing protein [Bacteroidetes bacterium]|nr:DUF2249 domain-containing protein [Bacteroidota bacterium]